MAMVVLQEGQPSWEKDTLEKKPPDGIRVKLIGPFTLDGPKQNCEFNDVILVSRLFKNYCFRSLDFGI